MNKQTEQETQVDIDLDAAQADISSSLFGEKEEDAGESEGAGAPEGEGQEAGKSDAEANAGASPPQSDEDNAEKEQAAGEAAGDENSEAVQATGAPSTWTKEALQTWAEIPPRAQQEILKREEDMMRGIEGYKVAADMGGKVSKILEPYAPILAAENIDPFQMLQSFAGNHYLLSRGTPEQKIQLAASLLTGYNIPLAPLLEYIADNGESQQVDPQITALRKELDELKGGITQQRTAQQSAAMEQVSREIDAFAADKENNPYFDEVADDMQRLFATGQANSLKEAYDKAIWNNPATRQKEIDRLTAEKTSAAAQEEQERSEKKAAAQADKLQVGDKPRDGTVISGSIDDTLNETLAAIESRG
jgi:hypothetical protein